MSARRTWLTAAALLLTATTSASAQIRLIELENHIRTPGSAVIDFTAGCPQQRVALPGSTRDLAWLNGGLTDVPGRATFTARCAVTSIAVAWTRSPTICTVRPFRSTGDGAMKYLVVGDRIRDCLDRGVYTEAGWAAR